MLQIRGVSIPTISQQFSQTAMTDRSVLSWVDMQYQLPVGEHQILKIELDVSCFEISPWANMRFQCLWDLKLFYWSKQPLIFHIF